MSVTKFVCAGLLSSFGSVALACDLPPLVAREADRRTSVARGRRPGPPTGIVAVTDIKLNREVIGCAWPGPRSIPANSNQAASQAPNTARTDPENSKGAVPNRILVMR